MVSNNNDSTVLHNLKKRIASGDELAFADLYHRYWDTLFISAHKILKEEEVCKDIVQEVFIDIWEKNNLNEVENLKAYLYQSVRFKVFMVLRKGKVSESHLATVRELSANTTEEQLAFTELHHTLEHAIDQLPAKCQEVFRLSRMENLSNREIAEKLGISIRTVETHVSNALGQLRSKLGVSTFAVVLFLITHF